jgi:hypothetical protein
MDVVTDDTVGGKTSSNAGKNKRGPLNGKN